GNKRAKVAYDVFIHRIKHYVGAYLAELGGADAIVFTAGVGENDEKKKKKFCEGLEELGIKLDRDANRNALARKGVDEAIISTPDSKVKIMMIATNEELVIVEDTIAIMNGTYNPDHLKMNYSFSKAK
ncbi:MAG: propionate kinase, partial [Alphaproteobacteria bacterium]|nr:propionate kinase [Alphaproteobacteria bacterium]